MYITIYKGYGLFGNSLKKEVMRKKYFIIKSVKSIETIVASITRN